MNDPTPATPCPMHDRVLIVDDEIMVMKSLCNTLTERGYETAGVITVAEALDALQRQEFDILLTDMQMPGMDGMALLQKAQAIDPHLVAIMMTGHATIETSVEAMKLGAFDYVQKPLKLRDLLPVLTRALEVRRLRQENVQLRELAGIYELSLAIGFTLDSDTILNKVMDAALQQFGADEASILLPTADGNELYVAAAKGPRRGQILGQHMAIGAGIAGWVTRHLESLILNGPVNDLRFTPVLPREDICSAMVVPMMVAGHCLGVLNVNATKLRRPFTQGQVKALSMLAGAVAPALKAAALHAQFASSEEYFRRITNNMLDFVFQVGMDGVHQYVTPSCQAMLGYRPEELVGRNVFDRVHPDDRDRIVKLFADTANTPDTVQLEFRHLHADGQYVWLETNARVLKAEKGPPVCIAASRDITDRVNAEENLRKSEQRLRELTGNLPHVLWMTNGDMSQVLYVNPAYEKVWGRPCESLISNPRSWLDAVHADDLSETLVLIEKLIRGECVNMSYRIVMPNRSVHAIADRGFPITDENGTVRRIVGFAEDVTERRNLESQLQQSQKMDAFGQLAGGVAHDFNNLLAIIIGYSDILLSDMVPAAEKQRDQLLEIRNAGDRAASLTRQLLAFSRKQKLLLVELDLNVLVSEMEKMLRRLIGEDIDLATALAPDLDSVKADPSQIEQVIMNLVINARDAMSIGGNITIETRNVELGQDDLQIHAEARPGHYVMLVVTDTGCGMDAAIRAKIFEPFFTTKEVGKGTGLGLATVYGIVKQSGGCIEVCSEVGHGTTFKVYLPRLKGMSSSSKSLPGVPLMPRGTESILLVEDEDAVRGIIRRVLESQGYTVLDARNGNDALQICQRHQSPIHLLVADVVMPKMSGRELAQLIVGLRPAIKVLYLSGYTDDAVFRHGVLESGLMFLQKPFTPLILAEKVRNALDQQCPNRAD